MHSLRERHRPGIFLSERIFLTFSRRKSACSVEYARVGRGTEPLSPRTRRAEPGAQGTRLDNTLTELLSPQSNYEIFLSVAIPKSANETRHEMLHPSSISSSAT